MKKKGLLKVLLITLFCSLLYFPSQSQTHKYFIISGKIMADTESLQNCTIQITKRDKKTIVSSVSGYGRFRLELEYNTDYKLVFNTEGCCPKTIEVNTAIPQELMDQQANLPHFLMAVRLSRENMALTSHVQEISYSEEQSCFAREKNQFDYDLVEKADPSVSDGYQSQIRKSRMAGYQIF